MQISKKNFCRCHLRWHTTDVINCPVLNWLINLQLCTSRTSLQNIKRFPLYDFEVAHNYTHNTMKVLMLMFPSSSALDLFCRNSEMFFAYIPVFVFCSLIDSSSSYFFSLLILLFHHFCFCGGSRKGVCDVWRPYPYIYICSTFVPSLIRPCYCLHF